MNNFHGTKTIYEPFLKFPSHEHQIIIHQTPGVWLAKRKEEVLVTLGEESHNSKLSNKLMIKCFGEEMEISMKEGMENIGHGQMRERSEVL
ncbi:hypothetical protein QL285_057584 [Trifolium repens]|nr:hypothetical protein QL285_057584 [Trifolium repens]